MANLAEGLQDELKRCRELLVEYAKLGMVGKFGGFMIGQAIEEAEKAILSGDVVRMIQAHEKLKGCD